MITTPSTTTTSTVGAFKKFATAAAIAGALGLAALGAAGTAAAAPTDDSGSKTPASSEQHTGPAAGTGDSVIHVHVIPGSIPKTPAATEPTIPTHLIPGFTPTPTPAEGEPVTPAHLIPGFTPKPATASVTPSSTRLGNVPGANDGPPCDDTYCHEVIDE